MENKILAKVGTLTVTEAEVNEFILSLGRNGQNYNTKEGRAMVLSRLIDSKLFLLDAKRNLLEADPEFKAQLAKLKDSLLVNFAMEKAISAVKPATDAEVEKYYNENGERFESGESVEASHILVATEDEAKSVYAEIASGAISFEDAAKKYSSCPSKENGGSLGEFTRGQMVPEFDTAVFSMEVGTVTAEPVKTQFGYHLIKLTKKNESTKAPLSEVKDSIREMLSAENQKKAYQSKVNQLKILYPVDLL